MANAFNKTAAIQRIERPCLCCKVAFISEGFHNRLCNTCCIADRGPDAPTIWVLIPHSGDPEYD